MNEASYEWYVRYIKNKNFVKEKGFSYAGETFQKVNDERGWNTFCEKPTKTCALIVKEFYVNLNGKVENDIYVRGKQVHLNIDEIHKDMSWSELKMKL